ncbi:MAG: hypothetical protein WA705_16295 [Candidatus Ozemobacteraceae bacterium]
MKTIAEKRNSRGAIAIIHAGILFLIGLCLFFIVWKYRDSETGKSNEERWADRARNSLLHQEKIPDFSGAGCYSIVPLVSNAASNSGAILIATLTSPLSFGLGDKEILRVRRIFRSAETSTASLHIPSQPDARIIISGAENGSGPLLVPWEGIGASPVLPAASPSSITAFLRQAGGNWIASDPSDPSRLLLDRLSVVCPPPHLVKMDVRETYENLLGQLAKAGRLFATIGNRIPAGLLRFPDRAGEMPFASGLLFEGVKLTPAIGVDWTAEFKERVRRGFPDSDLADVWERRREALPTWTPSLSDEIGPLMGSGLLRFNRPDVLSPKIAILNPMDEINLLRAFHAAGCETAPVTWFPNVCSPASMPFDPFPTAFLGLASFVEKPEDVRRILQERADDPFDLFLLLASGDLVLDGLPGKGMRVIACGSGSIRLNGKVSAKHSLVIAKGGNVVISCTGGKVPPLVALPGDFGEGGNVVLETSAPLSGAIRAESLILGTSSAEIFWDLEPSWNELFIPLLVRK